MPIRPPKYLVLRALIEESEHRKELQEIVSTLTLSINIYAPQKTLTDYFDLFEG